MPDCGRIWPIWSDSEFGQSGWILANAAGDQLDLARFCLKSDKSGRIPASTARIR
jgi:hypothetical protein